MAIQEWSIPLSSLILGTAILVFAGMNFKKTADRDSILLLTSNFQGIQSELTRTREDLNAARAEIRDLYSKWEDCEADKLALREDNERLMREALNLPQRPESHRRDTRRRDANP